MLEPSQREERLEYSHYIKYLLATLSFPMIMLGMMYLFTGPEEYLFYVGWFLLLLGSIILLIHPVAIRVNSIVERQRQEEQRESNQNQNQEQGEQQEEQNQV